MQLNQIKIKSTKKIKKILNKKTIIHYRFFIRKNWNSSSLPKLDHINKTSKKK